MVDYDYNEIREINEFILRVYNYFNGVVNPINKCIGIYLDATIMNDQLAFYDIDKHIIKVFPYNMINTFHEIKQQYDNSDGLFVVLIIDYIVHELLHADQYIKTFQMCNADDILNIEREVVQESKRYIIKNKLQIEQDLNIFLDVDIINNMASDMYMEPFVKYNRINLEQSYFKMLECFILNLDDNIDIVSECININVIVNDILFVVKNNNIYNQNITPLQQMLYDTCLRYTIAYTNIKSDISDDMTSYQLNIIITDQTIYPISRIVGIKKEDK